MSAKYPVNFTTFGMFIVDEIEWFSNKASKHDLIGGAGTYAVIGARLVSSPCQILSKSISWIVDVGSDFPPQIRTVIDSWNTNCTYRTDETRLTTRAWNGYGDNEHRAFKYLTEKIRLEVSSLSPQQVVSKSFHMVCSAERFMAISVELQSARSQAGITTKPVTIWEPIPDLCGPSQIAAVRNASSTCTIISPNNDELASFFHEQDTEYEQLEAVHTLMGWPSGNTLGKLQLSADQSPHITDGIMIVREGAKGSTAYLCGCIPIHLPAYHDSHMQSQVIDPTGAGNAYLGALALAMTGVLYGQPAHDIIVERLRSLLPKFMPHGRNSYELKSHATARGVMEVIVVAMVYATVAAGYVIEQHGVPTLKQTKIFTEIREDWNGRSFDRSVNEYLDRVEPVLLSRFVNGTLV